MVSELQLPHSLIYKLLHWHSKFRESLLLARRGEYVAQRQSLDGSLHIKTFMECYYLVGYNNEGSRWRVSKNKLVCSSRQWRPDNTASKYPCSLNQCAGNEMEARRQTGKQQVRLSKLYNFPILITQNFAIKNYSVYSLVINTSFRTKKPSFTRKYSLVLAIL